MELTIRFPISTKTPLTQEQLQSTNSVISKLAARIESELRKYDPNIEVAEPSSVEYHYDHMTLNAKKMVTSVKGQLEVVVQKIGGVPVVLPIESNVTEMKEVGSLVTLTLSRFVPIFRDQGESPYHVDRMHMKLRELIYKEMFYRCGKALTMRPGWKVAN